MTIKQRMAVVTGPGSGLGQAIGLELAADGERSQKTMSARGSWV